jgi:pyrroline-5-carboxylate reductase
MPRGGPRRAAAARHQPKGTTERAIAVLQGARLDGVFAEATDAALARAKEMAAGA